MRRPSPALAVACLALLVALTGTSYATVLNVPKNSVGTPQLKRNAVKPAKLAPNAVRTAHILNGSLLAADFKAGQLPTGAKGEKGDPGPVGVSGLEIVSTVSASSSAGKQQVASCPAEKKVLGGGASVGSAQTGVSVVQSQPTSATAWLARAEEANPVVVSWTLRTYAVCANVP
jgi:hypothetical protein